MTNIDVFESVVSISNRVNQWKSEGLKVGFVPTMGALHIGHESLIKKAAEQCDRVVVSIFVNPTQFGENEDFDKYPKTFDNDKKVCKCAGAEAIFYPAIEEMYHQKDKMPIIKVSDFYSTKLCGASRKGHFDGVATVVVKLLNIVQPDIAYFGLKDAQQFIILRNLCTDLNLSVKLVGCPIIRDSDGLACSSRNTYLSSEARGEALSLQVVLNNVLKLYGTGIKLKQELFKKSLKFLSPKMDLEYLEAVDFDTFEYVDIIKENTLIAIAAKVDGVRLIDNIIIS